MSGGRSRRALRTPAALIAFALAFAIPATSLAYRPFDSTDAAVAAAGAFELELGPLGYYKAPGRRFLVAPAYIGNLGLVRNWEFVFQGREFFLLDDIPGESKARFVETGLLLKGVIRPGTLQGRPGWSVATEFGFLPPNIRADKGVGATAAAIASYRWPAVTLHFNAAGTRTRAGNPDAFGSCIVEGPYSWPVRPVAEAFFEREFGVGNTTSGLVGAIYRASDRFSLDVAGRAARIVDQNVYEARAGFTWAIGGSE
ncbi:MAG: hypothetical protein HY898_27450 [Deltaproteobacteria bacterium]|nr:hypothetical protein [Deltaproteobacteria bacterium]